MSFNINDYIDVAERLRLTLEVYPQMTFQPANPLERYCYELQHRRLH